MASSHDYEVVTTDFPQDTTEPCNLSPNGGFLQLACLVPRGRDPGGDVGKITVLHIIRFPAPPDRQAPVRAPFQMTLNNNRMITIKMIRLMPPPP
jgi:hypothetical protein